MDEVKTLLGSGEDSEDLNIKGICPSLSYKQVYSVLAKLQERSDK